MDDETPAFPDQSDFEFFTIMLRNPWGELRLPDKFAKFLDGQEPREVKLREASGGRRLWDVEVVFDGEGQMYLERGWEEFARAHDVGPGNFLVFGYVGEAVLTVKVFDGTMCRRHYRYQHDDDEDASETPVPRSLQDITIKEEEFSVSPGSESNGDGGSSKNSIDADGDGKDGSDSDSNDSGGKNSSSSSSAEMEMDDIDDAPPTSQFTVTLKNSNLSARQQQYLNVPPGFQKAHEYDRRSEVALRMRGRSWTVKLKHNVRAGGRTRASLRYGWHQFCVDNGLDVGDVCFFRTLRGGGEDHALKVEVRKLDGTFLN